MLVHYYKTKCEVSGEDAPFSFLTSLYRIQNDLKSAIIYLSKWPFHVRHCEVVGICAS